MRLAIERCWDGSPADPGEVAFVDVALRGDALCVEIDAPHHGDPLPPRPPGSCEGLWEYEVVELFLLGASERYAELELGPAGHHLLLALSGRRQRVGPLEPLRVHCAREGSRWRGELWLAREALPPGLCAWNAYAIHGAGAARRYLAWQPVPGPRPDFHRLECFAPLPEPLRRQLDARG